MRPTKDLESLSLPTPRNRDYKAGHTTEANALARIERGYGLDVSEAIALLRTPIASEVEGGAVAPAVAKAKGQTLRLSGQMIDLVAPDQLPKLPTPTTRDYKDGSADHQRDGKVQTDTVSRAIFSSGQVKLFNTPTTMDAKATNNPEVAQKFLDQGRQTCLTYDVATNWGKFEPAIRRWEKILKRPAPEPTKPDGKNGNHRLSSKFTEWMMGVPEGWITGHNLKRTDELKLAGNGVVPQQAELALRLLLELPEEK